MTKRKVYKYDYNKKKKPTKKKSSIWAGFFESLFKNKSKAKMEQALRENKDQVKETGASYNVYRSRQTKSEAKVRTFGPKKSSKENQKKISPKIPSPFKKKITTPNRFSFGFKNPDRIVKKVQSFSKNGLVRQTKFLIYKWKIPEKFNQIVSVTISISIVIFLIYLTFLDTHFLVKDFKITFNSDCINPQATISAVDDCSYLGIDESEKLVEGIKKDPFLGFIPNNQFWFLNSKNLTAAAKSNNPQVTQIEVTERKWPNRATLQVSTKPILITLGLNDQEYWRIGQNGKVVSRDDANLRERVVNVESRVEFNRADASFSEFSFENNKEQLNRFWFIIWLWQNLQEKNIQWIKTSLPSLFDSDVIITTKNGTRLLFDYSSISRETQENRLDLVFDERSVIKENEAAGVYKYIDFRHSKRVFLCRLGTECENI